MTKKTLGLLEGYGIELEYMIVDRDSLDVKSIADWLMTQVGGGYEIEIERGNVAWSNELALHVIEIKTNGPARNLAHLDQRFNQHIQEINNLLKESNAMLMPTAMHPWMNPDLELKLWPHENNQIYKNFDRVFDCKGHGWANLQSTHINLPFANDEEFRKLHRAIRYILPLIPAIAASSPIVEGKYYPYLDARLDFYRHNSKRVPIISGAIIPEDVGSYDEYQTKILMRLYQAIAPHDPKGILQHEWLNARGAIARFDRMAIEIRLIDIQECPQADIAIAGAISSVLEALIDHEIDLNLNEVCLAEILKSTIIDADQAIIEDREFLEALEIKEKKLRASELWTVLIEKSVSRESLYPEWKNALQVIQEHGPLARRIKNALPKNFSKDELKSIYRELCLCLDEGVLFNP